jgi:repressor LexA
MSTTTERIKGLLENRGITAYKLCKELGIDDSTFSRSSRTADTWKSQHLIKMADYFKVSLDWLMKGDKVESELRKELKEAGKRCKQVPVLGIAECGKPATTWLDPGNKFIDMTDVAHLTTPFVLIAKGDSMIPYINLGDKLLCADEPERVKSGTAVVVTFNSPPETYEANAKLVKFEKSGDITLYSVNTKYPPTTHKESEIQKLFKLIRIVRDVK